MDGRIEGWMDVWMCGLAVEVEVVWGVDGLIDSCIDGVDEPSLSEPRAVVPVRAGSFLNLPSRAEMDGGWLAAWMVGCIGKRWIGRDGLQRMDRCTYGFEEFHGLMDWIGLDWTGLY